MSHKIGMIDIGSNTVRLVIYERFRGSVRYECIENIKVTARLREHFDAEGKLSETGIARLLDILKNFLSVLTHYEVTEYTSVATASLRLATNRDDVLRRVQRETSMNIRLLSDYEEAYYGFFAIHQSMNVEEAVTIDIGGGSTEVTHFKRGTIVNYHSFEFGALSLKMQFVKGDIPTDKERQKLKAFLDESFRSLGWLTHLHVPVIAIGGSARSIGKIHQQLTNYPLDELHHYEMTLAELKEVDHHLRTYTLHDLEKHDAINKDRADTVPLAVRTFRTLCHVVGSETWIISNKGLRDGLLYKMQGLTEEQPDALVEESIQELKRRFTIEGRLWEYWMRFAQQLYDEIERLHPKFTEWEARVFRYATPLFNLGKKANAEVNNMTFFLISHYTLLGLSQKERIMIALIASYKNRRLFQQYVEPFARWFTEEELDRLMTLGAILKVAQTLDRTRCAHVTSIQLEETESKHWTARIYHHQSIGPELYHFMNQKKHIERRYNVFITPVLQHVYSPT